VGGNAGPAECTGTTRAATGNDWMETDEASALAANACYIFTVATGAGPLTFEFDAQRSGTGPTNFAVQVKPTLVSTPVTVLTGTPMTAAFGANPMHTADLSSVPNISNQAAAEIRICAWGASGASGTFRIDNVRLQGP
jgi:hypothetical protein